MTDAQKKIGNAFIGIAQSILALNSGNSERETMVESIKADDIVRHIPSGETWVVCGVSKDGKDIIPCGWPFPSLARAADCELLKRGNGQTRDEKDALERYGLVSFIEDATDNRMVVR